LPTRRVFAVKQFYHPELLIRKLENAYMPFGREKAFHPFNMHIRILAAGAMAHINTELEHLETIRQQLLPENGVGFPVFFGFCREVKKYKYPHNAVSV
jgi:hypothetical protein